MAAGFRSPAQVARRLRILPLARRQLQNWASFVWHYALGFTPAGPYRFRNGASLQIARALDHVPLIEIFLRQDYGQIEDRAVILDLGANIGVFSVYAASHARGVQVYAYEPWPAFFELLQANIRRNGQEKIVRCYNFAVAASPANRDLLVEGCDVFFPRLLGVAERPAGATQVHSVPCTDPGRDPGDQCA